MRLAILASAAVLMLGVAAAPAGAEGAGRSCGKVGGVPIHAHGVTCHEARRVYRADMSGHVPHGWICSASLARCYKGGFDSGRFMWWRRTTYRPLVLAGLWEARREGIVLGGEGFAPNGEGWGEEHPSAIYNGGDASGSVTDIRWNSWGGSTATGWGRNPIFKPHGGYYKHPVWIKLKASAVGKCEGRRAYTRLSFRAPKRPGGRLGSWRSWSGASTICSWPY
jgi:hypothetical protein